MLRSPVVGVGPRRARRFRALLGAALLLASLAGGAVAEDPEAEGAGLAVGSFAPQVVFAAPDGSATPLSSLLEQPLLLVFHRGAKSPHARAQLQALRAAELKLLEKGVRVVAAGPVPVEELAALAERDSLQFTLLADAALEAADAFGVRYETTSAERERLALFGEEAGEHHVSPALFLLAVDGRVLWRRVERDPRSVTSADALLAVADEHVAPAAATPPAQVP